MGTDKLHAASSLRGGFLLPVILFAAILVLPVRSGAAVVIRLAPRPVKMVVKPMPRTVVFRSLPVRSAVNAPAMCSPYARKFRRPAAALLARRLPRPDHGRHVWVAGHWVKKPYRARYWVSGHWKLIR